MCTLYSMTKGRAAVVALVRGIDRNNNQPPMPGIYPDYAAPAVVQGADSAREMRDMRWGMPSPKNVVYEAASKRADKLRAKGGGVDFNELLRMEPDKGVTNATPPVRTGGPGWAPRTGAWCR